MGEKIRRAAQGLPPSKWLAFYWFRFDGLPVTFPALPTRHFRWTHLRGVQIGRWFFGGIKGGPGEPCTPPTTTTDEGRPA